MSAYRPTKLESLDPPCECCITARDAPSRASIVSDPSRNPYLGGTSLGAQMLRAAVAQLAHGEIDILIHGEPGSGKHAIAHAIAFEAGHTAAVQVIDGRVPGPLDGRLPEPSCTSAFRNDRGTSVVPTSTPASTILYIRNIDALALAQQEELVNWARARRTRRVRLIASVGSSPTEHAAPQLDPALDRMVGVVRLSVPPLRLRKEDISPIAERWRRRRTAREGTAPAIDKAAIAALRGWAWPENVTELLAVLDRAASSGTRHLTAERMRALVPKREEAMVSAHVLPLAQVELSYIRSAVERCNNNHTRAARLLGIGRSTLIRKLKQALEMEK